MGYHTPIMESKKAIVFHDTAENRYSYNALAGALETDEFFDDIPIYFLNNSNTFLNDLQILASVHETIVVGISFATPQLWTISPLIKKLRKKYAKQLILLAGGPHPSGDLSGTLSIGFDIAAKGEGEELIIDLLKSLFTGRSIQDIAGIAFLQTDNQVQYTGNRERVYLDRFPPFAVKHRKMGPIEITRGCPYLCHYCQTGFLTGTQPRHRSIDSICTYVDIMRRNNLKDIRFITPNAFSYGLTDGRNIQLGILEELLKSVRKIMARDGKLFWGTCPSEVRPDHVTPETIALVLKYADNHNLVIGAQSGSQRILDHCNRSHSVDDIYHAVDVVIHAGLRANVDFIFGLPGETENDIMQTIKVIHDLAQKGAKIHAHTFMPLPGTYFNHAAAGRIKPLWKKPINYLASHGIIYGNWIRQEAMSKRIENYFKSR